jgi:FkbM family methyltransferase
MQLHDLRSTLKGRLRALAIPLARSYIRYAPIAAGKRPLWQSVVEPRLAWAPHAFVARTRFGSAISGNTVDRIQRYIYYFGVWEPHLSRWLGETLRPGDFFVDVGASIGYYTLLAAGLCGGAGKVIAIEASPTTFAALLANLRRNGVMNVRAVNLAVSDQEGSVPVYRAPEQNLGMTTTVRTDEAGFRYECDVRALPLPRILSPDEVARTRVIKIDVEGAEAAVAQGLMPLLPALPPAAEIVMEVSPERLAPQGRSAQALIEAFAGHGFHAYVLRNDYSASDYLPPYPVHRPTRLAGPLLEQSDIVFSRRDAEVL